MFVLKDIFTRTTVKYKVLCILSRVRIFFFTAFDCAGSKISERPKSFLQVVKQSCFFTGFEGESFLGFHFRAFCVKSS